MSSRPLKALRAARACVSESSDGSGLSFFARCVCIFSETENMMRLQDRSICTSRMEFLGEIDVGE